MFLVKYNSIMDTFHPCYLFFLNITSLQAVTITANTWINAGHAVNYVYDILHMMDRDDIPVGVGGEGGILPNGTILPNVGGYLPIIDQVHGKFITLFHTDFGKPEHVSLKS